MPAEPPAWRLIVRHPVPVLYRRRGGGLGLSDAEARTEVSVRGARGLAADPVPGTLGLPHDADPERMVGVHVPGLRFARGRPDPVRRVREVYLHRGRLWRPVDGVDGQLARMGKAARSGERPFKVEYGMAPLGAPFAVCVASHLAELHASYRRETPDRIRKAAVLDLSGAAAEALRAYAGADLVHDGERLFAAVSPPAIAATGEPEVDVPEMMHAAGVGAVHDTHDHYVVPYLRMRDVALHAGLFQRDPRRLARIEQAARDCAGACAGIDPGDADVAAFVNAAPSELLDMLRQGRPDEALSGLAERLWPWAALGSIGAVRGADRAEALVAIRRVAAAMAEGHPTARHRNRCTFLVRYLDAVARPRLDAGRTLPDADALSLEGLARVP